MKFATAGNGRGESGLTPKVRRLENAVETINLTESYRNVSAPDGLSPNIGRNEILVRLGGNGSSKTMQGSPTLVNDVRLRTRPMGVRGFEFHLPYIRQHEDAISCRPTNLCGQR